MGKKCTRTTKEKETGKLSTGNRVIAHYVSSNEAALAQAAKETG